jgi:prevent-host-death family protein
VQPWRDFKTQITAKITRLRRNSLAATARSSNIPCAAVLTILSILSSIGVMRTVSATDAKQRLAALLDAAQREPVVIRRQNRDVAVIMSAQEYERMRDLNAAEFQRFCDRVAAGSKARGLTEAVLKKLLKD